MPRNSYSCRGAGDRALGGARCENSALPDDRERRHRRHRDGVGQSSRRRPCGDAGAAPPRHLRGAQAVARTAHPHGAGGGGGGGARRHARGAHQGDRAHRRLGLEHHTAAARHAAGGLSQVQLPGDPDRPAGDDGEAAVGAEHSLGAVLRADERGAAAGVRRVLDGGAQGVRRQPRQQGAGGRHVAVPAGVRGRRQLLVRRRACACRATARCA